jgi:hypothetical protein
VFGGHATTVTEGCNTWSEQGKCASPRDQATATEMPTAAIITKTGTA